MSTSYPCEALHKRTLLTLLIIFIWSMSSFTPAQSAGDNLSITTSANIAEYATPPIAFEQNVGQFDSRVAYVARGAQMTTYLTADGAVFVIRSPQADAVDAPSDGEVVDVEEQATAIYMTLDSATAQPRIVAEGGQVGVSNYFVSEDASQWHTNVAHFAAITYRDIYPGIDMVYYGQANVLRYDFVVHPGADPTQIAMHFEGQTSLALDAAGSLHASVGTAALTQDAPFTYQNRNGTAHEVRSQFRVEGNDVRFEVDAYDPTLPLIIDPSLTYSTYLGGSLVDEGYSVTTDDAGNAYVTGYARSTNFPTTPGAVDVSHNGGTTTGDSGNDVFVTKLDATGGGRIYSTYLGGSNDDRGFSIAVDGAGNAYVTGRTASTNFPTTVGALDTALGGSRDAFVTKLDAAGSVLTYSTYLGGTGTDHAEALAVDGAGNVYVTGLTSSSNFPTTVGAFDRSRSGQDAFVAKLNAAGSALTYATFLGGSGAETAFDIALDSATNVYVTGRTASTNFPTTTGAFDTTRSGTDAFVTKLNAAGSALLYSTFLGGSGTDIGNGLVVDAAGLAHVVGQTLSADFPTTAGAYDTSHNGLADAFAAKVNATGTALTYSSYLGGSSNDYGLSIAVDGMGNAYLTGYTNSSNFPTTAGAYDTTRNGTDGFLTRVNAAGNAVTYSTFFGGSGTDRGVELSFDGASSLYLTGFTQSSNFSTTTGAFDRSLGDTRDAFVAKFIVPAPEPDGDKIGVKAIANGIITLRNRLSGGAADYTFVYGFPTDVALTGDWNGDNLDTMGFYRPSTAFFTLSDQPLSAVNGLPTSTYNFGYGSLGDQPVVGDWDGNGRDSVAVYRPSNQTFYLRNALNGGFSDVEIFMSFALAGDLPIAGDWNGDGRATPGVYRPSSGTFLLTNRFTTGTATVDSTFSFGAIGAVPVAGDWDGNGSDGIGVYSAGVFSLRNSLTSGAADYTIAFGATGDKPLAGRWVAPSGASAPSEVAPSFVPTN